MNSTLYTKDDKIQFEGHIDEDYFYLQNNVNYKDNKVLVFVPEPVYESGEVNTDKVIDVQNTDHTLEELLAADVLYLIESPNFTPYYVTNLLEEVTGEFRNYYVLYTAH